MRLDERGKQCPLPVIEAKKALESSAPGEKVEVVVDNEIAVQNLTKMADHKGFAVCSEKTGEREFLVTITTGEGNGETAQAPAAAEEVTCTPDGRRKGMVVVLSSNQMGQGDEVLGKLLMKGFVFALTQQDMLPESRSLRQPLIWREVWTPLRKICIGHIRRLHRLQTMHQKKRSWRNL